MIYRRYRGRDKIYEMHLSELGVLLGYYIDDNHRTKLQLL